MTVRILTGDCLSVLATLPAESVDCCVTSPPYYGLRDYGHAGQIGREPTPQDYVDRLVAVFREVRRVLNPAGTFWLNLGDSWAANRSYQVAQSKGGPKHGPARAVSGRGQRAADYVLKPKDLIGIPWRVAFALQADGWYLRQCNIWHKPNAMPESVTDRDANAHEYVFHLAKSERYFYNHDAVKVPGNGGRTFNGGAAYSKGSGRNDAGSRNNQPCDRRNRRSVWTIATQPYSGAHFATMPPALAEACILAGCPDGGTVLDPFGGAGTTGLAADRLRRNAILVEINPEYADIARDRIRADAGLLTDVA